MANIIKEGAKVSFRCGDKIHRGKIKKVTGTAALVHERNRTPWMVPIKDLEVEK